MEMTQGMSWCYEMEEVVNHYAQRSCIKLFSIYMFYFVTAAMDSQLGCAAIIPSLRHWSRTALGVQKVAVLNHLWSIL